MAQVFVHNTRIPHPHYPEVGARFFENPRASLQSTPEPPPAHRSILPSTTPYAAANLTGVSADLSMHSQLVEREREREHEREKERMSSIPGK